MTILCLCREERSAVFDHAVVFHPGYRERFARAGHPGAFLLPHAVRRAFFEGAERAREFDVGWVGKTRGPWYKSRAEWLPKLAAEFRMNDWRQSFTLEETAAIYRRSRIVVNIGRDDFPQDANLCVFEVLASGALLITSLPSELTQLGFQNGVHFVGCRDHSDLIGIVRRYLADETSRSRSRMAHARLLFPNTRMTGALNNCSRILPRPAKRGLLTPEIGPNPCPSCRA